jgi:hypothetical protein
MPNIPVTRDLAAEMADLLEVAPRDLTAATIVDALRRSTSNGGPSGDVSEEEVTRRNAARLEEIVGLYQPIHEACKQQLFGSDGGRGLEAAYAQLESELDEIRIQLDAEKVAAAEAQRDAADLLEKFRRQNRDAILSVAYEESELQPSVESLAKVLHSDLDRPSKWPTWTAEIMPFQAVLLREAAGEDVGVTRQGLGDPQAPQTVGMCFSPAYALDATSSWQVPLAFPIGSANKATGYASAWCWAVTAGATSNTARVGGDDIHVPAGVTRYVAEVHFDYRLNASCWAVLGLAICGGGFVVQIDKGDGSPPERIDRPLFSLVSAVASGAGVSESGPRTITVPFTRDSSAGIVNVTAGVSSHCETGGGIASMCNVELSTTVKEICVRSA